MLIFWLDISLSIKSLRRSRFIQARTPLIIAFFVTIAIIVPASVYNAAANTTVALAVFNAVMCIILLGFIVFTFIFGAKLYKELKKITKTKDLAAKILLDRVNSN